MASRFVPYQVVKLRKHTISRFSAPARVMAWLLGTFLLCACATQGTTSFNPPPLTNFNPITATPDVDVLEVSPEMDVFLERYVLPYASLRTRLEMLTVAVTSGGVLGFDYNETLTLTASQAFEARSGNCIGFANLMVALARKAGLTASYQEVRRKTQWSIRSDMLLAVKHINIIISGPDFSYVIDISGLKFENDEPKRLVSDAYAKALYYSNIGAEALLRNELPVAWAYLVSATRLQSGVTDPWINLGVVYKRNGQARAAEMVYRSALRINPHEFSAMNNLYELYLTEENSPAAAELAAKVEKYRRSNPYYLMKLSEIALQEGDFEQSIDLIRLAIRNKDDDARLYFTMAKALFLSGNMLAAENSLIQARSIAPDNQAIFYDRPLNELVMESLVEPVCPNQGYCPR